MAAPKPKNIYPCTMAELYTICRMGWTSFLANVVLFTESFSFYTLQFGQDALAEVDAAEAMPEFQERNQETELAFVELKKQGKLALRQWKFLRNHIKNSFPEENHKAMLESAGSDHYDKASNQNWGELRNMLTAGSNFIAANTAVLTTGGMPAAFPANYELQRTAYDDVLVSFTALEQDEVEGTDLKVEANNELYRKLMSMFDDGVLVFEDVPAKRDRFVFAHLKEIITNSPGNGTGVPSTVIEIEAFLYDSATEQPIVGGLLKVLNAPNQEPVVGISNAEGIVKVKVTGFAPNEEVLLDMEVSADGYEPGSGQMDMTAGNLYSLDIPMDALLPPPPPSPPDPEP